MIREDRFAWANEAPEATVAVGEDPPPTAEQLLSRLGRVEAYGRLPFVEACDLQGSLYDDGTFDRRAVFQAERLPGTNGPWWATVEPNGFRASDVSSLQTLAAGRNAAAFFWNINAVMRLTRVAAGAVLTDFDPLLEVDAVPADGRDLPFGDAPRSAAIGLLERWTGVAITEPWFLATKPTFIVETRIR